MGGSEAQTWCSAVGEVQGLPTTLRLTDDMLLVETPDDAQHRAIPLSRVTGVRAQVGLRTGFVTVEVHDLDGPGKIVVSRVPKADARCFESALREVLKHPPVGPVVPEFEAPPLDEAVTSPLAELERLARLREAGVVTAEEFEAAKRTLLGRL